MAQGLRFAGSRRRRARPRRRASPLLRGLPLALALLLGVGVAGSLFGEPNPAGGPSGAAGLVQSHLGGDFHLCAGGTRRSCVVDGDTIWLDGTKIRLADIDTPETHEPHCATEAARGQRATMRLLAWVNAGPFEVMPAGAHDTDRYGRKLRILARRGHSVGETLLAEGLAHPWDGARHSWCG